MFSFLVHNIMAYANPAWKYWWQKEGQKSSILCKFCDYVMQHKEVSSFIFHLTYYFDEHNNKVKKCPNVPLEVQREILDYMLRGRSEKARKEFMIKNVPAELRGNLESSYQHIVDDSDDKEDSFMFFDDMDLMKKELVEIDLYRKSLDVKINKKQNSLERKTRRIKSHNLNIFKAYLHHFINLKQGKRWMK